MAKLEVLTSAANPLLKDVRKAIARGTLTEQGYCVAETFHLLEEALRSDCRVHHILAAESVRGTVEKHVKHLREPQLTVVADRLFESLVSTESTQGVVALVEPPKWSVEHLLRGHALVVVLDGVQDPGNAGTIARSAEAFGATGMMFLKGSVSAFNPKTLRASAGSLFRVPFVQALDSALARVALQQNKIEIFSGVPRDGRYPQQTLEQADLTRKCALVIGSEGRGVSDEFRSVSLDLAIPTVGVESLNAGVAASILLYEARRQRSLAS